MEKKKYILGIIVSILVISIGTTFAYFATRSMLIGSGTQTEGTTVSLGDTTVNIEGFLDFNDLNIYPGHKTVSRIKVTATGDKNVLYNLIWNGQNNIKTPLNYTVYKTTNEQNPSIACEKKQEGNLTTIFYEECSESNFDDLGEVVSSGSIATMSAESIYHLTLNESIQATSSGSVVYYYVVLEYPNKEESQNIDMNGTFNGEVTIELIKQELIGKDLILANNVIDNSRSNGTFTEPYIDNTAGKIFSTEDDDGSTYFFAGSNPNNWVKFGKYSESTPDVYLGYYSSTSLIYKEYATLEECQSATSYNVNCSIGISKGKDMYWRIIRINGDGSIRLIYNGPTTDQTGSTTQIGKSAFNTSSNDNAYVGYMYGTVGSSTYEETHANTNSSTIKTYLDNWYNINLKTNYEQYIDQNAGFCGDRAVDNYTSGYTGDGTIKTKTEYAPRKRANNTYTATYKCSNSNDYYTISTSTKGNKALENPVGLITSDEVMYAGGYKSVSGLTYNHWLKTGQIYLTLSPSNFLGSNAYVLLVNSSGSVSYNGVSTARGVRPVISLKSDTLKVGSGTTSDPYRIA